MGREFVLFHRLAAPECASIRARIVELGLKPALWDGSRPYEGADAIRLALGDIIAAEEHRP